MKTVTRYFTFFSMATSKACGTPWAFLMALLFVIGWACLGPYYEYSDSWSLLINTGTTIITFLMVFLIQATQNRDATLVQLKLDELIRVTDAARNQLLDLDEASSEEIEDMKAKKI